MIFGVASAVQPLFGAGARAERWSHDVRLEGARQPTQLLGVSAEAGVAMVTNRNFVALVHDFMAGTDFQRAAGSMLIALRQVTFAISVCVEIFDVLTFNGHLEPVLQSDTIMLYITCGIVGVANT